MPQPANPNRATRADLAVALAITLLCCWGAGAARCRAQGRVLPPQAPIVQSATSGGALSVEFSHQPIPQHGRQTLRLKVDALKPSNRDRSITVRFQASRSYGSDYGADLAVEANAELPAGVGSVTIQVPAPKLHDWESLGAEVWVDGFRDKRLSIWTQAQSPNVPYGVCLLYPEQSDPAPAAALTPAEQDAIRQRQQSSEPFVQAFHEPLPDDWRLLTSYHAVVLSVDDLRLLHDDQPGKLSVLLRWVRAGGALIVEGVGSDFGELAEVDRVLAMRREPFDPLLTLGAPSEQPLESAQRRGASPEVRPETRPYDASPSWEWVDLRPRLNGSSGSPTTRLQGAFLKASLGFGEVLALRAELPHAPTQAELGRLQAFNNQDVEAGSAGGAGLPIAGVDAALATIELSAAATDYLKRWDWGLRHGFAPDQGVPEFADWLAPGVGAAPVDAFRWLITLFVLLVGPASFLLLRAHHRTHLLALIAPLAAAAFTACLFGYAFLSDGTGLRPRVRSITFLDQRQREAVSWSRQSYYAGLAPAEGLTFPSTAAVYPLMAPWEAEEAMYGAPLERELLLTAGRDRYASGWLRSRETTQFLVINAGPSRAAMVVQQDGATPTALNRLGVPVERLIVRGTRGDWWQCGRVEPDAAAPLQSVEHNDLGAELRRVFSAAAPAAPPGLGSDELSSYTYYRSWGYYSGSLSQGRLETIMRRLQGLDGGRAAPLKPGAFLAITSEGVGVPVGHAAAREVGSFHVTVGEWQRP